MKRMITTTSKLGEQRVILQDISWHCFEYLLSELGETRAARLTYDRGVLEIMTPLIERTFNQKQTKYRSYSRPAAGFSGRSRIFSLSS
jgi:hypothetical protein